MSDTATNTAANATKELPPADVMELSNGEMNPNFRESNSFTVKSKSGAEIKVVPDFKRSEKEKKVVDGKEVEVVAPKKIVFVPAEDTAASNILSFFGDEFADAVLKARARQVFIFWTDKSTDEKTDEFNKEFFEDLCLNQKFIPVKLGELKEKLAKAMKAVVNFTNRLETEGKYDYDNSRPKSEEDHAEYLKLTAEMIKLSQEVTQKSRKRKNKDGEDDGEE